MHSPLKIYKTHAIHSIFSLATVAFNCSTTSTTLGDFSLFNFAHSCKCWLTSHWELFHVFLDHLYILVIFCEESIQVFAYFSLFSFSSYHSLWEFFFVFWIHIYTLWRFSLSLWLPSSLWKYFLLLCSSLHNFINVVFWWADFFLKNYYIFLITATLKAKEKGGQQRMQWLDSITNSVDMTLSKQGDSGGQGSLVLFSPWSHKESDST